MSTRMPPTRPSGSLKICVVGVAPSSAQAQPYVDMLAQGQTTVAGLGVLAAENGLNQVRIGLTGLTEQGLHFAL